MASQLMRALTVLVCLVIVACGPASPAPAAGLVRYKPGDSTAFAADLATTLPGATTSTNGKQTWTFILRQGVMCHPADGVSAYELTSDDAVYSLRKATNKDTSAYASDYAGMTSPTSWFNRRCGSKPNTWLWPTWSRIRSDTQSRSTRGVRTSTTGMS